MPPRSVKILILIHMGISLGGILAHIKIHPLRDSLYFWWASPMSIFSLLVIPFLFFRSTTVAWGFMANAFTVLTGTIGMTYYSLHDMESPVTIYRLLTESTLPAILVLWAKVPVACFILHKMRTTEPSLIRQGCVE